MAIMKSEQILSESPKSFEDAIQTAVARFSKTVRGLRSANVNNLSTVIENGDQVQVLRSKAQVPQPAWLNLAITAKALAAIRRHLRTV